MSHRPKFERRCSYQSGFVADGFERLVKDARCKAHRIVEAKYADQWNASGLLKRWKLQRQMETEIAALTSELMPDASPHAMF